MNMRITVRALAILIAIAALIDPVWTAGAPPLRELIAIDLTAGASDRAAAGLEASAPRSQVIRRRATGGRLPCGPHERCVAIADGSTDVDVPPDVAALSVITMRPSGSPNLTLRSVAVSAGHAAAAGAVTVEVSRAGTIASTDIRIHDGTAIVGSTTHKWMDGETATIDVPWWPIEAGARTLRIEAVAVEGEVTSIDNAIDVGVAVMADQSRVLVFDARPSWNSTFVRRALEDDPRFAVEYRARVAPGLSAGTARGALDAGALEASQLVIVGGPDALTASETALLDRFVTRRGGSLILLPEQRPGGPVTRFFGDTWTEQLTPAPQQIGALRATEILRMDRAQITAVVLGRSRARALGEVEGASIVAMPSGHGRVIISGAMDAWRYRHLDDGAFDRFWRSLAAEASAAGDALRIQFASGIASRGDRVPFTLRYRTIEEHGAVEARVSVRCGDAAPVPVRVWPTGALDEFAGEIAAAKTGQCQIDARAGNRSAIGFVAVAERPARGVEATLAKLERAARDIGGVVVKAGDPSTSLRAGESAIARALDDSTAESSRSVSVYPMRASWWIVPFAGLLSLEWFLRRRHGLR